jgi:hypothetical protein
VRVVVTAFVLLGLIVPAHAETDPVAKAKAEELSKAARAKIADRADWASASDLFLQAYELTKELPYLINVAVSLRRVPLPHQSVAAYQRCLKEGGTQLTKELRDQILIDIDRIRRESAQVTVGTAGADAAIYLDDRAVGTASKAVQLVLLVNTEAGREHKLRAEREGFQTIEKKLQPLQAGELIAVEIEPIRVATTGIVKVTSKPDAAELVLVGRGPIGRAPQTLELLAGDHYLQARLPKYELASERVPVIAGREHQVVFELERTAPSWWEKHKLVVVIASGAALATGAAIAGYFLFQPDYDGTTIKFP